MEVKQKFEPNEQQRKCIENIEGKYLVLAGPGTGKTYTITQRIKYMIEKGVNPSEILCLTFTDAATTEMKTRIEKEFNKLSLDINIFTYHSFCTQIIEENIEKFELPTNYKVIPESISRAFVKECIDEINPKYHRTSKNDPYYYIDEIVGNISEIKKNRLTKEKFYQNIKENPDWEPQIQILKDELDNPKSRKKPETILNAIEEIEEKINKAFELWEFFELYEKKMHENRYLDFNDMINFVLDSFEKDPLFLDEVANKYKYILVDEYQDTNKSQNAIIFNLAKALQTQNVFVVGDDAQIIYGFQGAKLDTIENFLVNFPDTKVVCLKENMRSTQEILDCARKLILQDKNSLELNPRFQKYQIDKNLVSKNEDLKEKNKKVRCNKYCDLLQEYNDIVDEIEELINSSECPKDKEGNKKLNEIAILTAFNDELNNFAHILKNRNIPFELKEGKNIFEIPAVNVLYFYIQALVNPYMYSNRLLQLLLIHPFKLNSKDYTLIFQNNSNEKDLIKNIKAIDFALFEEAEKIKNFIQTYEYLKLFKDKENIKTTILEIGAKTGIFDFYLNDEINRTENIAGLKKFIDIAIEFSNLYKTGFLEAFVEYIELCNKDNIIIKTDKAPVSLNAIQLLTYHGSKGREFEYVYMPTLVANKWESSRKSIKAKIPLDKTEYKTKDELRDEKITNAIKVLYVGMTRAKHTLRLSYVQKMNKKGNDLSKLISEIQDEMMNKEIQNEYDEISFWEENAKTLVKKEYNYKKDFKELIASKLNNRSYSPSAINTYLNCPRQYFYEKILDLAGLDGNPDAVSYGSAIHYALEFAVGFALENKEYPKIDNIKEKFNQKLKVLPISDYEHRGNLIARGENALEKYYPILLNTPIDMLNAIENKIFYESDEYKFYGIIDRIDKNQDGTYSIYDYKTGNAKKITDVCVNGEYENYYNQMGLYKYFYEKLSGNTVSSTKFIFVEDFQNNLELKYTQEEIDEIVEKFKKAIESINNMEFEPKKCEKSCTRCIYRTFCSMEAV